MSSLIVATPRVVETKESPHSERYVKVKATEQPGGALSVHYEADVEDEVPVIHDNVLVAVCQGAPPQWLPDDPNHELFEITYEADSSNNSNQVIRLEEAPIGDMKRLKITTWNRASADEAELIVLTKGQVTSLIMTLLALYPRLHES